MSDNQKPTHKVFVVEEREGEGKERMRSGRASARPGPHKDGKGFNVVLSALPVNGRLVLRTFTEEDDKADNEQAHVRRVDFKKR